MGLTGKAVSFQDPNYQGVLSTGFAPWNWKLHESTQFHQNDWRGSQCRSNLVALTAGDRMKRRHFIALLGSTVAAKTVAAAKLRPERRNGWTEGQHWQETAA